MRGSGQVCHVSHVGSKGEESWFVRGVGDVGWEDSRAQARLSMSPQGPHAIVAWARGRPN